MRKAKSLETQIVAALRKVWMYSKVRRDALKAGYLGDGWWKCARCEVKTERPTVDHTIPVVRPEEGFKDWGVFITNLLYCEVRELDVLCRACHRNKTKNENALRRKSRTQV